MRIARLFALVLIGGLAASTPSRAADLEKLKVLYIGSERNEDFTKFLTGKVTKVEAKSRTDFKLKDAEGFDVVLLDWPQNEETRDMRKLTSPLGKREDWKTPTVLLGSAGLNLAVSWKMKGGSGCTCLDPLAYDLREHPIFEKPFPIDRKKMVSIPTPKDFRDEIQESEIKVLPIVDDYQKKWHPGWCTHAKSFPKYPDVEFFCGGVNHQTPTSAALWRQGNLLHFGFDQSPAEMNEIGQHLLLNSIAYISQFSEDRPIAINPSVFGGPAARSRSTAAFWLKDPEFPVKSIMSLFEPELRVKLSTDRAELLKWAEANARFLRPNKDGNLEMDEDLVALNIPFDKPEFFDKVLGDLHSKDNDRVARAGRLLSRYVPDLPADVSVEALEKWWKEIKAYAFTSDDADYRWYVDPLAKKRCIPITECRGLVRADRK